MKITILYDNEAYLKTLRSDWGFSCLIQTGGKNILFDTGARGAILLENMHSLGIRPETIDLVFISHPHWDHVGGLSDFLACNPTRVYIPANCPAPRHATEVIRVQNSLKIDEAIFSTGALDNFEQSMVISQGDKLVVIVGCSHPGVRRILSAASKIGNVRALIGGLHGFSEFELIKDLEWICPAHCTQHTQQIQTLYPQKFIGGGAGKIIEL